jgi:hypothetical protein
LNSGLHADYLLEKNPTAGAKIKVDVEEMGLKIAELTMRDANGQSRWRLAL